MPRKIVEMHKIKYEHQEMIYHGGFL